MNWLCCSGAPTSILFYEIHHRQTARRCIIDSELQFSTIFFSCVLRTLLLGLELDKFWIDTIRNGAWIKRLNYYRKIKNYYSARRYTIYDTLFTVPLFDTIRDSSNCSAVSITDRYNNWLISDTFCEVIAENNISDMWQMSKFKWLVFHRLN